jgi:hypothetical protein
LPADLNQLVNRPAGVNHFDRGSRQLVTGLEGFEKGFGPAIDELSVWQKSVYRRCMFEPAPAAVNATVKIL